MKLLLVLKYMGTFVFLAHKGFERDKCNKVTKWKVVR